MLTYTYVCIDHCVCVDKYMHVCVCHDIDIASAVVWV